MYRRHLFAATSVVALSAGMAAAQEGVFDGGDIGTVTINEGLRGVATDTAAPETTIDQEELDARQATTTGQLLDTVPNVTLLNGNTPQGAGVNIRGLGSQSGLYSSDGTVSVVVDGVRSGSEEIYRNGSVLALEPELFKEVTVTRGPSGGFRYSSSAVGGTIELETKDARDFLVDGDTFAFRQKLGFETNGERPLATSILAFAPDDRFEGLLFFGYRDSEEYKDGDGDRTPGTDFRQRSALVKGTYSFDAASSLTFSYVYNDVPQKDVLYNSFDGVVDSFFGRVDRDITDQTAYLEYAFASGDMVDLTARLQFKREEVLIDPLGQSDTGIFNADHVTETLSILVENTSRFSFGTTSNELLVGLEIGQRERTSLVAGGVNDPSAPGGTDDYIAIFAQNDISIGDRLTVTPSLRYERQKLTSENNPGSARVGPAIPDGTEVKDDVFTGGVSVLYDVTDTVAVFGTLAYNANLPIFDDFYSEDPLNTIEKARTVELGFSYDGFDVFVPSDSLAFKFTAFRTDISDGRTYSNSGAFSSDIDLYGFEVEAEYVHPAFYANLAAGLNRGNVNELSDGTKVDEFFEENTADNIEVTLGRRFLDNQIDAFVTIDHNFANDRTQAGTFGELIPDGRGGLRPNLSATTETDAFTLVDLGLGYTPSSGPLEGTTFRASLNNVFDEQYRQYGSSRPGEGRNLVISVARTF